MTETRQAFELLKKAADKKGHSDPKARIYGALQDVSALVADEMKQLRERERNV